MVPALLTLLLCQLIGEIISQGLHLPVPGPVLGMVFLATGLIINGKLPEKLAKAADFLLAHLSLFFVPAAVGVMAHGNRILLEWLPLSAAILISTILTIAITAWVFQTTERLLQRRGTHRTPHDQ